MDHLGAEQGVTFRNAPSDDRDTAASVQNLLRFLLETPAVTALMCAGLALEQVGVNRGAYVKRLSARMPCEFGQC